MLICICSSKTGLKKNLHVDTDTGLFVTSHEHASWCVHSSVRSIEDTARLMSIKTPQVPERFQNLSREISSKNPAWAQMLPAEESKKYVSKLVDFVKKAWDASSDYEKLIFPQGNEVLFSLEKMDIDEKILKETSDSSGVLDSFREGGIPRYDRFAAVTGRMSVTEGPDITRLRKDLRKIILPETSTRGVYQIDMVALEPTLALLIDGQRCPDDVYTHISEKVLSGHVGRPEAKVTTICAIYGISAQKLAQKLPKGVDAKRVLGDVRSYLNIPGLLVKLRAESSGGYIKNFYGRRITAQEDSPLINYYLQSTGVDAALLAFREFDRMSRSAGVEISKKGVIHDALVFTCEKSAVDELSSIAASIPVTGIGNLRAKIKEIS